MAQRIRLQHCPTGFSKLLAGVLLVLAALLERSSGHPTASPNCNSNATSFDFIIIGGGTAGLALAARLSQGLVDNCILVIEAGQDGRDEPGIYIPGREGSTFGTKYDWNLTTVPQPNVNNRVISMTRGKVLGGSSALNLMTWDRASKAEYDMWEELGNPGWNWDSMYQTMLKVENFTSSPDYGKAGVGHGGPIQTLINRILPRHQLAFPPAMEQLGLRENLESLDRYPIGVLRSPSNIRASNYTRSYSPTYLELAKSNLILTIGTRVARINFNGETATGVTLQDGTSITASKEVILSAGTLQSPGLLELSGIGDDNFLKAAGVNKTIYNLPGVGENLQDHIRTQNSYQLKPGYTSVDILRYNATYAAQQLTLYNSNDPSLYDYTGSGYAFMNWSQVSNATASSLIPLAYKAANFSSPIDQKKLTYLNSSLATQVPQLEVIFSDGYTGVKGYPTNGSSLYGAEFFTIIAGVQHPFSRGSVHINSSSLLAPPVIDPKYLSNDYDLAALMIAAKYARLIASTAPLSDVWSSEYEPGPQISTGEQWQNYAKSSMLSIYHPVGTCAMLPEKAGGVVDSQLKVYGTKGLRVVDASVMPILVYNCGGNPCCIREPPLTL
ncbi:GMC oxidoreductase [Glonium stellatum]|uniref:GMC oxidoreductase n=1 Tax=Glonium stellatum TaxID=574774 RepID=A0A8E2F941_9PEZI|nr:GMC oxidoreductase [Glonium stellatum]